MDLPTAPADRCKLVKGTSDLAERGSAEAAGSERQAAGGG
jgi:hypothetical protein